MSRSVSYVATGAAWDSTARTQPSRMSTEDSRWQSHGRFHPGRGRGAVWMRSPPSEPRSAGSPAGERGSERGAFYQKGTEPVQATIWGMSSPATSVKRMFRPL